MLTCTPTSPCLAQMSVCPSSHLWSKCGAFGVFGIFGVLLVISLIRIFASVHHWSVRNNTNLKILFVFENRTIKLLQITIHCCSLCDILLQVLRVFLSECSDWLVFGGDFYGSNIETTGLVRPHNTGMKKLYLFIVATMLRFIPL